MIPNEQWERDGSPLLCLKCGREYREAEFTQTHPTGLVCPEGHARSGMFVPDRYFGERR